MKASLSVIIIAQDEAARLPECLASVAFADEIIVVDSGSSDNSQEIARAAGAKVYQHNDWLGFGVQKQRAQSYASCDWILAVDADEVISTELRASIEHMLQHPPANTVFALWEKTWVFGRFLAHSGWYYPHIRLYPRQDCGYDEAIVHEKVRYPANYQVQKLSGDILHYSYQDLRHYLRKSADYAVAFANKPGKMQKKTSLSSATLHALGCFFKMYLLKAGFLDGKQGFLIAVLSAHSTFIKYAEVWIRQNDSRQSR